MILLDLPVGIPDFSCSPAHAAVYCLANVPAATNVRKENMPDSANTKVTVGAQAPDFELPGADGRKVSLASFRKKSVVVLFFYPKNNTAVCTKEACLFRDAFEDFSDNGATVIGISSDPISSHEQFAKQHSLPFLLLSDAHGAVRKKYQIKSTLGIIPGRVTFVIDKNGIIRHSFQSMLDAQKHVMEALTSVKALVGEGTK